MGPRTAPSTLTIEPVALLPRLLGGGPTAIRTRVTSSASSCDIQATLWVQQVMDPRLLYNPDGLVEVSFEFDFRSWFLLAGLTTVVK